MNIIKNQVDGWSSLCTQDLLPPLFLLCPLEVPDKIQSLLINWKWHDFCNCIEDKHEKEKGK